MIYLSSNTKRREKIKDIYKKYNDLPSHIVKQIIDYKLNKSNSFNLSKAIKDVWNINQEIAKTEAAIQDAIKSVKMINSPYIYELPVFVDCGKYATKTTVKFAIDRLNQLRNTRREIIQTARYEHVVRLLLKSNRREVYDSLPENFDDAGNIDLKLGYNKVDG